MINLGWSLLDFTRWYKFLSILRLKCRQEKSKKFLKNANFFTVMWIRIPHVCF